MAIGILVLMLSLAGQVFTITVQSTGKATALTEVSQQLRLFEETLRADLAAIDPQRTLLVIQGNPVNAFWTQENREAGAAIASSGQGVPSDGYPHAKDPDREDLTADAAVQARGGRFVKPRADILFFYTARPAASSLNPQVTSNLQQVVYGHAELGEFIPAPTFQPNNPDYDFDVALGDPDSSDNAYFPVSPISAVRYPDPTQASQMPAQNWHLARRSTLLLPTPAQPSSGGTNLVFADGVLSLPKAAAREIFAGERDHVGSFEYESIVLRPMGPPPYFFPRILMDPTNIPFARSLLDETPPPMLSNDADGDGIHNNQFFGLGHYMLPNCASFKVEWALDPRSPFVNARLDGLTETLWFDPGDEGDGSINSSNPLRSLEAKIDALQAEINNASTSQKPVLQAVRAQLSSLLNDRVCMSMSCPEACDPTQLGPDGLQFSLAGRFQGPAADGACGWARSNLALDPNINNIAVFTAGRPRDSDGNGLDANDPIVPDPMFPGALRITVDVFDNRARLDRPIRHVMVIPIGS